MVGKNNLQVKRGKRANKFYRYSIKRLSVGVASVAVAAGLLFAGDAAVVEVAAAEVSEESSELVLNEGEPTAEEESSAENVSVAKELTDEEEPAKEETAPVAEEIAEAPVEETTVQAEAEEETPQAQAVTYAAPENAPEVNTGETRSEGQVNSQYEPYASQEATYYRYGRVGDAKQAVDNVAELPDDAQYEFVDPQVFQTVGLKKADVKVTYADGSYDIVKVPIEVNNAYEKDGQTYSGTMIQDLTRPEKKNEAETPLTVSVEDVASAAAQDSNTLNVEFATQFIGNQNGRQRYVYLGLDDRLASHVTQVVGSGPKSSAGTDFSDYKFEWERVALPNGTLTNSWRRIMADKTTAAYRDNPSVFNGTEVSIGQVGFATIHLDQTIKDIIASDQNKTSNGDWMVTAHILDKDGKVLDNTINTVTVNTETPPYKELNNATRTQEKWFTNAGGRYKYFQEANNGNGGLVFTQHITKSSGSTLNGYGAQPNREWAYRFEIDKRLLPYIDSVDAHFMSEAQSPEVYHAEDDHRARFANESQLAGGTQREGWVDYEHRVNLGNDKIQTSYTGLKGGNGEPQTGISGSMSPVEMFDNRVDPNMPEKVGGYRYGDSELQPGQGYFTLDTVASNVDSRQVNFNPGFSYPAGVRIVLNLKDGVTLNDILAENKGRDENFGVIGYFVNSKDELIPNSHADMFMSVPDVDGDGVVDDIDDNIETETPQPSEADANAPTGNNLETPQDVTPAAADGIANKDALPADTSYEWESPVDVSSPGEKDAVVIVNYPDNSQDRVPIKVTVKEAPTEQDADKYEPTAETVTKDHGQAPTEEEVKNAVSIPDYPTEGEQPTVTVDDLSQLPDGQTPGTTDVPVTVIYPDGSEDKVNVPVTVKEAEPETAHVTHSIRVDGQPLLVQKGKTPEESLPEEFRNIKVTLTSTEDPSVQFESGSKWIGGIGFPVTKNFDLAKIPLGEYKVTIDGFDPTNSDYEIDDTGLTDGGSLTVTDNLGNQFINFVTKEAEPTEEDADKYTPTAGQVTKDYGQAPNEEEIKNAVNIPEYPSEGDQPTVTVDDPSQLPDGQTPGTTEVPVTVTYPDGSEDKLTVPVTIEEPKTEIGGSVKPVDPTDEKQGTGITVTNPDDQTTVTATDEDGKKVPAEINPETGAIEVIPGTDVDGPIDVVIEDEDLPNGKATIPVPVNGHEDGRDDNGSEDKPATEQTRVDDSKVNPVDPSEDQQSTGIVIVNPDDETKVSAKDEDGKDVPVEVVTDGRFGDVKVTPGTDVDGPITITIEDPELPEGKQEVTVPVNGHEAGRDDNAPETEIGGAVKSVDPTDEKQGTGITVINSDDTTTVTATDEDGKHVPAEINPETGEVEVTPGTDVDGPIDVVIEDEDLPNGKATIPVQVNGHEAGRDDNTSEEDATKTEVGGAVKPVHPSDEKQGTGIVITNPDETTTVTATDEDGKQVPAEINPETGEIEVTPGTDVDGPIKVVIEDEDLPRGRATIPVQVVGHEEGRDDNGSEDKPATEQTQVDDSKLNPVDPTDNQQSTGIMIVNPDVDTKVTAKDEDGKELPVEVVTDGRFGDIKVTPGTDVDGPITVIIEDPELPGGKQEVTLPVNGHETGQDDNKPEQDITKTEVGGAVKPVYPSDEKQGTGIIITNPDENTTVTATDEDGKEVPAQINPGTGEIEVTPGTDVDGPIKVVIEDEDLPRGKATIPVQVVGHEAGRDDNKSEDKLADEPTDDEDTSHVPDETSSDNQDTGIKDDNAEEDHETEPASNPVVPVNHNEEDEPSKVEETVENTKASKTDPSKTSHDVKDNEAVQSSEAKVSTARVHSKLPQTGAVAGLASSLALALIGAGSILVVGKRKK